MFDSVSRLSRDAEDGAALYEERYQRGIDLVFLNEPHCGMERYRQAAASIPAMGNEIADIYIEATNRVLMLLAVAAVDPMELGLRWEGCLGPYGTRAPVFALNRRLRHAVLTSFSK